MWRVDGQQAQRLRSRPNFQQSRNGRAAPPTPRVYTQIPMVCRMACSQPRTVHWCHPPGYSHLGGWGFRAKFPPPRDSAQSQTHPVHRLVRINSWTTVSPLAGLEARQETHSSVVLDRQHGQPTQRASHRSSPWIKVTSSSDAWPHWPERHR